MIMPRYSRFSKADHARLHGLLRSGMEDGTIRHLLGASDADLQYHRIVCAAVDATFTDDHPDIIETEEEACLMTPSTPAPDDTPNPQKTLYDRIRAGEDLRALAAETGLPYARIRATAGGLATRGHSKNGRPAKGTPSAAPEAPTPAAADHPNEGTSVPPDAVIRVLEAKKETLYAVWQEKKQALDTAYEADVRALTATIQLLREEQPR